MTKNDIVTDLRNRIPGLDKFTASDAVEAVIGSLSDAFMRGDNVYIRGFATMEVKTTKEKKARNIRAGATIVIPAQRTVRFKISKQLKNRMNNGK